MREQVEVLEDHADVAADLVDLLEIVGELRAVDDDLALLVLLQPVDAADHRRLARAGRAADDQLLAECRLIMVDPKMLELSVYDGIPHLLTPVVTDPKKAVVALKWAVREMEERYKKMSKLAVRNIDGFNARVGEAKAAGEVITRTVQTGFDKHSGEAIYEEEVMDLEPLPYIVVIVDEMADLMMVAGKEIEGTIQRLAQMARAAGIHVSRGRRARRADHSRHRHRPGTGRARASPRSLSLRRPARPTR